MQTFPSLQRGWCHLRGRAAEGEVRPLTTTCHTWIENWAAALLKPALRVGGARQASPGQMDMHNPDSFQQGTARFPTEKVSISPPLDISESGIRCMGMHTVPQEGQKEFWGDGRNKEMKGAEIQILPLTSQVSPGKSIF